MIKKVGTLGAAAIVSGSAIFALITGGGTAHAAGTPLQVTLGTQVQGDGSSATWSGTGDPVLTVGTGTSTTGAYITLNNIGIDVPSTEPTFTTDNYAAGSPRWVIQLSNGHSLWGYPPNSNLNGSDFAWAVDNGSTYTSYSDAVTAAEGGSTGVTVKLAQIIADGDQAPGTADTITNVSYDGRTIGAGTVTVLAPATQNATVGAAYSLQVQGSTTSSDPNLTYSSSVLPAGLTLDSSTGLISGTPTEAGQFAVTVSAEDAYGDKSADENFVLDVASNTVVTTVQAGPGYIKNAGTGLCLDVTNGVWAVGTGLQEYTCGASWGGVKGANQQLELRGTLANGQTTGHLEAIQPNGTVWYVVSSGTSGSALELSATPATVVKVGPYYYFPQQTGSNGNLVMDVKGGLHANNTPVIVYGYHAGVTQQWSLP